MMRRTFSFFSLLHSSSSFIAVPPNCTSGTRSEVTSRELRQRNISFHKFPLQKGKEELLKKWLKKISRKDFVPKKSFKICSLHFHPDDFKKERTDKKERRKRKLGGERTLRILKDDAVADLDKLDTEQGKECYTVEFVSQFASEIEKRLDQERSATLNGSDLNVTWYVAGAVARSELKLRKFCPSCQELLLSDPGETEAKLPYMTVEGQVSENVKQFCEDINRGGLLAPSMPAFAACIKAWLVYNIIMKEEPLKKAFLSKKPQELFVKTVMHLLWEDSDLVEESVAAVESLNCAASHHECINGIVRRFFNVMAKNLVKKLSSEERPCERKTMKLTGKSKWQ